jgi:hypothetical protein
MSGAHETRRRDQIGIYRRKYVAGHVALKQLAARPAGMFADAIWAHIARAPLSPADRELFHLDPARSETAVATPVPACAGDGNRDRDALSPTQPSMCWGCAFCGKLRIWDGGRPDRFDHLGSCGACGSRVAIGPDEQVAVISMIDKHLL